MGLRGAVLGGLEGLYCGVKRGSTGGFRGVVLGV